MTPDLIEKLISLGWALIYAMGALGSAMGVREATFWAGKWRQRKRPEIEQTSYVPRDRRDTDIRERVTIIQEKMLHQLESMRKENNKAHDDIEEDLREIRNKL